jgi:TusE/DsrC/DsvC family sulfur relay protein
MNTPQDTNPGTGDNSGFPHAPPDWQPGVAERIAADEGLELGPDHWRLVRGLQEYFFRHEESDISVRELKDALEEAFHREGGIRYLHRLFPGGPVAQGCRLAGLTVPPGAVDKSFGSVQ